MINYTPVTTSALTAVSLVLVVLAMLLVPYPAAAGINRVRSRMRRRLGPDSASIAMISLSLFALFGTVTVLLIAGSAQNTNLAVARSQVITEVQDKYDLRITEGQATKLTTGDIVDVSGGRWAKVVRDGQNYTVELR